MLMSNALGLYFGPTRASVFAVSFQRPQRLIHFLRQASATEDLFYPKVPKVGLFHMYVQINNAVVFVIIQTSKL